MDASRPDPAVKDSVRRTLADLAATHPLRVKGSDARRMIRKLEREGGCSQAQYRALWARPEDSFGPFESLPEPLQVGLGDAVGWEMRERNFTVSDRLHGVVYGPVFRLGSELARLGKSIRARGRRTRGLGRVVFLWGRGITASCEWLGRRWLDISRYAPFTRTSGLHALWKWAGVDPLLLSIDYVCRVPCDPRLCPVHRSRDLNVESCALLGLDLITSGGEVFYLEANSNSGFMQQRLQTHPTEDPICRGLSAYACEHGLSRIVLFPSRVTSISEELEQKWRAAFEAHGIGFEVRDDPRVRSRYRRACDPFMDMEAADTLYVNGRSLRSPFHTLIRKKGLLEAEIERHNARSPVAECIRVPQRLHSSEDLPAFDPDSMFPNLIVKHSLRDMAEGITLYKTDRIADGALSEPYAAFEYVRPDLVVRQVNGSFAGFARKYRVFLLVTPDGPLYLGGLRQVATTPLPAGLPKGRVEDLRPYVVNGHLGVSTLPSDAFEEDLLGPATLGIGRVIGEFIRRKHDPTWRKSAVSPARV